MSDSAVMSYSQSRFSGHAAGVDSYKGVDVSHHAISIAVPSQTHVAPT